jgi:phospholipase C
LVNDLYSIGYYRRDDFSFYFSFYGPAVNHWTIFDRYFSATMAGTFPNKIHQWAARSDRRDNSFGLCTLPTIFDLLLAAGRTATYYFSDVPFTAFWGTKYLTITRPFTQFLADATSGNLPDVAFVDPHEWGGFFDHVPPQEVPDGSDPSLGLALRGFRTPAMMIAPWARGKESKHGISSTVYDHTSVLKMIEWRWGLPSLTVRDANANNLAADLDFNSKPRKNAPRYDVPAGFLGSPCTPVPIPDKWDTLRSLASSFGFLLP